MAQLDLFIGKVDTLIINPVIYFLFALAIVFFLWGVFECIKNQANGEKKNNCKEHMLWGLVGIFIMLSVWAIMSILVNTLGVSGQINPQQGTVNLGP
jgi:uncharacterized membrane protein